MLTPGAKAISAFLAIGTIATCKMVYNRKRDIKDAAKSRTLIQQRRKEYFEEIARTKDSSL